MCIKTIKHSMFVIHLKSCHVPLLTWLPSIPMQESKTPLGILDEEINTGEIPIYKTTGSAEGLTLGMRLQDWLPYTLELFYQGHLNICLISD